jgi:hypothetical protein
MAAAGVGDPARAYLVALRTPISTGAQASPIATDAVIAVGADRDVAGRTYVAAISSVQPFQAHRAGTVTVAFPTRITHASRNTAFAFATKVTGGVRGALQFAVLPSVARRGAGAGPTTASPVGAHAATVARQRRFVRWHPASRAVDPVESRKALSAETVGCYGEGAVTDAVTSSRYSVVADAVPAAGG